MEHTKHTRRARRERIRWARRADAAIFKALRQLERADLYREELARGIRFDAYMELQEATR